MLPKYSVLQNCASSSLLQLELSKEILFSSFIGHKQHFCTWNVPWASSIHHQGTLSLRVQGWAALSRDNIPCTPFTWTLPLSDPSVCTRCLLEAHLHRFLQGLARSCILLVHTGFCNWRQIKKNGLLMTLLIHKSCCILKAESSDSCKVGTVWLISTNFTLNNLGNIYMYNTISHRRRTTISGKFSPSMSHCSVVSKMAMEVSIFSNSISESFTRQSHYPHIQYSPIFISS